MILKIYELEDIDHGQLKEKLSKASSLTLLFPVPSIGVSNSHLDIISDLLYISFCCEKIAYFINTIDSEFITRDRYYLDFQIRCSANDIDGLTESLIFSSKLLNNETTDDARMLEFKDGILGYEDSLNKRLFAFPDIINRYWANLINGAYWEIASEFYESEDEFFRITYKKHPEHRFEFWRSAKAKTFNAPIYISTESWIVPPTTDLIKALQVYSGLNFRLELNDAEKVEYNGRIILLTNNAAVYFNETPKLIKAIECTQTALAKYSSTNIKRLPQEPQISLWDGIYDKKTRRRSTKQRFEPSLLSFKVSEFGDLIVAKYQGFSHVFFVRNALSFEEIKELDHYLFPAFAKTQTLIANSISNNCNWLELNDDSFEELCYDILYCHPKFDSATIQKMGKSRSRDGGRDITIRSKGTPTSESKLYIFQCKFLSSSSSLTASKIPNAANVIMQYDAKGYGVFTTAVIDATLYDMLEGFRKTNNTDVSITMSKYELERHLNLHQTIKSKYFK